MKPFIYARTLAFLFFVTLTGAVFADQRSTFIHIACVPEIGYFEITPTYIWNVPEDESTKLLIQKKHNLFSAGSGMYSCVLHGSTIKIKYQTKSCNHDENSQFIIDMWVNNLKVINQIVFADTCYSAGATRIWYSESGNIGFDANPAYGMFDGGPVTVSFFVGLVGEKFNNFSAHDELLPITMGHLNQRIASLITKVK